MAAVNPPYFMQNGAHPAAAFRRPLEAVLKQLAGAFPAWQGVVGATDLAVTAGAGLSVNVAAGEAFIAGTDSSTLQGAYHVLNDAAVNLPLAAADATNPRNDLVIARVRDQEYVGAVSSWAVEVLTGAPAAVPADPARPPTSMDLARVRVAAGAVSVVAANIDEGRTRVGDWIGYTPVWTTAGTAPALGNGSLAGRYRLIGRTMFLSIALTIGTTTTTGTGVWAFSLPAGIAARDYGVGTGIAIKAAAGSFRATPEWAAAAGAISVLVPASTTSTALNYVQNVVPAGAWANGDRVTLMATLEIR